MHANPFLTVYCDTFFVHQRLGTPGSSKLQEIPDFDQEFVHAKGSFLFVAICIHSCLELAQLNAQLYGMSFFCCVVIHHAFNDIRYFHLTYAVLVNISSFPPSPSKHSPKPLFTSSAAASKATLLLFVVAVTQ